MAGSEATLSASLIVAASLLKLASECEIQVSFHRAFVPLTFVQLDQLQIALANEAESTERRIQALSLLVQTGVLCVRPETFCINDLTSAVNYLLQPNALRKIIDLVERCGFLPYILTNIYPIRDRGVIMPIEQNVHEILHRLLSQHRSKSK